MKRIKPTPLCVTPPRPRSNINVVRGPEELQTYRRVILDTDLPREIKDRIWSNLLVTHCDEKSSYSSIRRMYTGAVFGVPKSYGVVMSFNWGAAPEPTRYWLLVYDHLIDPENYPLEGLPECDVPPKLRIQ